MQRNVHVVSFNTIPCPQVRKKNRGPKMAARPPAIKAPPALVGPAKRGTSRLGAGQCVRQGRRKFFPVGSR